MKNVLFLLFTFFSFQLFSQTHYIEIHEDQRVASLLMTETEYESWKTNYDYSDQTTRVLF